MNSQLQKTMQKTMQKQKGATLVVSLVILAIVTVLGLASMRNSNLELKMAASARDRGTAFQTAESALRKVESALMATPVGMNQLKSSCGNGSECFDSTCSGGLCFSGSLESKADCSLAGLGGEVKQHWQNPAVWSTDTLHQKIDIPKGSDLTEVNEVKFIVEFMCFVPNPTMNVTDTLDASKSDLPIYRITVRAEGESNRSSVMLQSVYRAL